MRRAGWRAGILTATVTAVVATTQTGLAPGLGPASAPSGSVAVAPAAIAPPLPDPDRLTALLKAVSTRGIGEVSVLVTTPEGDVLADRGGDRALTPASTMKVLTAMTAIDVLGADRVFTTRVVSAGAGTVVLVGGGDPFLTDRTSAASWRTASLQALAKDTAAALKAAGRTSIRLRYDATLFSGPTFSPKWKARWRGYEARVAALEINAGLTAAGRAQADPARYAARAFAERLRAAGVTVTSVAEGAAGSGDTVAAVSSATLSRIVKRTLMVSDNVAAETISRHAAIASGRDPSFTGAAANVRDWLTANGLWRSGATLLDASGLAPGNKLTARLLAGAIRLALAEEEFAPVIGGLPVAAESGTLKNRFDDPSEKAGRHVVHAKTGTLSGLAALAGYLTTDDGAVLVFAELANDATSYDRAYDWLDRTAAVVADCGCR